MAVTSAKLKDWLEIVGLFAVVASLLFVGMQMRQEAAIAATDSGDQLVATLGSWQHGLLPGGYRYTPRYRLGCHARSRRCLS